MVVDQMANFMAGSILFSIGIIILVIALVIINNILSRFWKPMKFYHYEARFVDDDSEKTQPPKTK